MSLELSDEEIEAILKIQGWRRIVSWREVTPLKILYFKGFILVEAQEPFLWVELSSEGARLADDIRSKKWKEKFYRTDDDGNRIPHGKGKKKR